MAGFNIAWGSWEGKYCRMGGGMKATKEMWKKELRENGLLGRVLGMGKASLNGCLVKDAPSDVAL